jgi:hypothetical protein
MAFLLMLLDQIDHAAVDFVVCLHLAQPHHDFRHGHRLPVGSPLCKRLKNIGNPDDSGFQGNLRGLQVKRLTAAIE